MVILKVTTPEGSTRYAEVTLDGFLDLNGQKIRASKIEPIPPEEEREYDIAASFREVRFTALVRGNVKRARQALGTCARVLEPPHVSRMITRACACLHLLRTASVA